MTKYHSKAVSIDGHRFPSKLEAERYIQLKMMSQSDPPLISDLELQPEFQILRGYINPKTGEKIKSRFYVADFKYVDNIEHKTIVEDTKGIETDVFRVKWDIVRTEYPQFEFRKLKRKDI